MQTMLADLELKFATHTNELVPSLGRLHSLLLNISKPASFTQYCGLFQNLRESLEIFTRKSTADVEKTRKTYLESQTGTSGLSFFNSLLSALSSFGGKSGQIELSLSRIEEAIYSLNSSADRAAFCVLLQRPSFTGSDRFKLNELESKPEQEEALQKLVVTGGDCLYMSPSYEWIVDATDLIEAVPLFIYERTLVSEGKAVTVFEVDQEGLELTIRNIAEFWAMNIEKTIESEHLRMARTMIVKSKPEFMNLAVKINKDEGVSMEICEILVLEAMVYKCLSGREEMERKIAKVAQWIGGVYEEMAGRVEVEVDKAWARQEFISRVEALERLIHVDEMVLNEAYAKSGKNIFFIFFCSRV